MKKSKLFRALTLCRLPEDPGTRYGYSGGGYEIVQALIESKLFGSFDRAMHELVFSRAGMSSSIFAQPLPIALMGRAVRGHYADGRELAGGWRIVPELAAGGLWSTPTDLAKLLIEIVRAYRGEPRFGAWTIRSLAISRMRILGWDEGGERRPRSQGDV